jgi:membrane protein DedA with SNARE-associated domain
MNKYTIYFILGCILSVALCIFAVCFVTWKWSFSQMEVGERLAIVMFSIGAIAINCIIMANLKYLENEK